MKRVDVLVVGAGPAGLMAGLTLARAGVSVVLVDKRTFRDAPVACGEAVSRWFMERFGFPLDAPWIKAPVSRLEMVMPSGGMFYAPYEGFSLDRRAMEDHLARELVKAGGHISRGEAFITASRQGDAWVVETSQGRWKAAFILGCDGPRSRVAALMGWEGRRWLLALQYKFPFNPYSHQALRFYYDHALPYGYLYLFPRGDELTVGVGGLGDGTYLRRYLEKFLAREGLDPSQRKAFVAGLIPHAPLIWPPGGEGCLLCGDAAGFVHPMTKGGIHLACYSGREAAKALLDSGERNWGRREPCLRYMRALKQVKCLRPRWYASRVDLSLLPNKVLKRVGEAMDHRPYYSLPVVEFLKRPSLLPWVPRLLRIQWRYRVSHEWGW